ncbi:quinone oxidoreductase [Methylovirgula sp. HY1]|uniref:quinone oxidoreductase family protein n=1 Tax=Methylovirgula sp. HY1 TaxID=2822761 RepID=UPI001C5BC89A|nr:quinone oxidoreductase [Methylovirgula sp. HY1]QXX73660.1 Quinone oxidoreductase 1 [Methylovirgula sp. HY1]
MVKAVRVHEVGAAEVMRLEEIELPPPGPGEVRVRNHAIGLNYIDVYFRSGLYPVAQKPFIPGNEAAGEVVAVGEGVKGFKPGTRVAYTVSLGCYAEERNVDASRLVKLPKAISYETGAAMMLKGLTAQYLLRRTYKVRKGDRILVHAAAGGVGLILCQWGKALGAHVIGTVGSPEKAKLAKKAGAKDVILYRDVDFVDAVKTLTKGKLCDVVYDGVGRATFPGSLDCLRPLGMFVSFGSASGPIEAFNIGILSQKGSLFVTRPTLHTYIAKREDLEKNAQDLMRMVTKGHIEIPIHATRKLDEIVAVHQALEARETVGATVLLP